MVPYLTEEYYNFLVHYAQNPNEVPMLLEGSYNIMMDNDSSTIKYTFEYTHTARSFKAINRDVRYYSTTSKGQVHWHITNGMTKAHQVLLRSLAYAEANNPELHKFLVQQCSHLFTIESMTTHTSLPLIDMDLMKSLSNLHSLTRDCDLTYVASKHGNNSGGCYAFFDKLTKELLYIGSAASFVKRSYNHIAELSRTDKSPSSFYKSLRLLGGFSYCEWGIIHSLPNYISLYETLVGKCDLKTKGILELFTVFECRSAEQAYMAHYKPKYNSGANVAFGLKWEEDTEHCLIKINDDAPITLYTKAGEVFEFTTTKAACIFAGLSTKTVRSRYNREPPLWCGAIQRN